MSTPSLKVEMGFGSTMFTASPTWTDVTDYVRYRPSLTIQRGRLRIDGRFATGRATLTLENLDGRFTPDNTAGAYSPDVKVGVPCRITRTVGMTTYNLFYGSVRGWPPAFPLSGDATVRVPLADGFYTLNLEDLAGLSYSAESTDSRIGNVLDDVGWPAGLRSLDTGVAGVQATKFALPETGGEQPALLHLLDVAESEAGVLFMSQDGNVTFQNRVAQSGVTAGTTFSDANENISGMTYAFDDSYLYNVIRVAREDGAQVEIDDSGSDPKRVLTKDVMPMANDPEALNVAEWLEAIFGQQRLRIEQLTVKPLKSNLLETVLGLELRDYINVTHVPPGGDTINQDCAIEKITHRIVDDDWTTIFDVAPLTTTETQSYWILGTSQLDTETRLA